MHSTISMKCRKTCGGKHRNRDSGRGINGANLSHAQTTEIKNRKCKKIAPREYKATTPTDPRLKTHTNITPHILT